MMRHHQKPDSIDALLERCLEMAGCRVGQVAARLGVTAPERLVRHKGWLGQLVEAYLGAWAGSKALPDFPDLGIELKTVPVNAQGNPAESTYVSLVPLKPTQLTQLSWETSSVKRKLAHVLWLPYESDSRVPLWDRRLGSGILWQPDAAQRQILKMDWSELMGLVRLGRLAEITPKQGQYLQIRPKAANAKALVNTIDEDGQLIQTLPRGFYLRSTVTKQLLWP